MIASVTKLLLAYENRRMQSITIRKNRESKKLSNCIKKEVLNWLRHTQFHGANILANRETSVFWIPLMLGLLSFTAILMFLSINRFQRRPTYISRLENLNKDQSFPTVIICPQIRFENYKKEQFLSNLNYPEGLNRSYIWEILPQLSAFTSLDVSFNIDDLQNIEYFLRYNNIDVETATKQLTLSCEETLLRCRWIGKIVNCSELFRMELTGDGLCCVFNGRSLRRLSNFGREMQEKHKDIERPTVKWRTSQIGYRHGLMIAINQSQKHDAVDFSYKWMSLQPAQRFVDININGSALTPNREQWLSHHIISFNITTTAKNLNPSLRRCHMDTQPLKYFPIYRQKYCTLECEMARTMKMCGCLRTVHPRPRGVPYCNAKHINCARHAMVSLTNKFSCYCPAVCTADTSYTAISSIALSSASRSIDSFYDSLNFSKITIVRAFFSRSRKCKERHSYFKYLDLFSQLGGTFNVVFGCSIITILSLLHLILKIIFILIRYSIKWQNTKLIKVQNTNKILKTQ